MYRTFISLSFFSLICLQLLEAVTPLTVIENEIPTKEAQKTARYAVTEYHQQVMDELAEMVTFKTVAVKGLPLSENAEFSGFKNHIKKLSNSLGFNYQDHGHILIVSYGQQQQRLGILVHGDVQPADASKWKKNPFELDRTSEPGLLIARGTEDDKGSIASILYAMKSIKDKNIKLKRKLELIIYLAEESDWEPFKTFLKTYFPPEINVTLDASYPVVTAEKGYSAIQVDIPMVNQTYNTAYISQFSGGVFGSQVPEDATVEIKNVSQKLVARLKNRADNYPQVDYQFSLNNKTLNITAKGKSAHSADPENGINAVAFIAQILSRESWPKTTAGLAVAYINELVGIGYHAEKFGEIAYEDDFMGKMTMVSSIVKPSDIGIHLNLNLRRPKGKTEAVLISQTEQALKGWQNKHSIKLENIKISYGDPLVLDSAPHVRPLLKIFAHYTGIKNPQPISIGGSTNAKLLPNTLSFGPSMPGEAYTGHSEHEFISVKQLALNLEMYTAMMVELGNL